MIEFPSALPLIAATLAAIIDPPVPVKPSEWARNNLVVPDGPHAGDLIDLDLTPYLVEPLDALGPDTGVNKIVVRKSAQTGFTTLGIAWIGHTIDRDPCRMGVVQPTDGALSEFLSEKLNLAISGSTALKAKVRSQKSRSADGSTAYTKRFSGGSLSCMIATSTADLRSRTLKKILKDEASEYPDDLNGQGSPHAMIAARYESFLATGDWKEANISTPVLKGACYISEEFEAGDQRFWHVPCPHCAGEFTFSPDPKCFRFNREYPYQAHFVAPCCGAIIHANEKNTLVRKGRWVPMAPGDGKHRSYHLDSLSSPFVPWDIIAKRVIDAGDDPAKQKGLFNLTFGLPYEMLTDVPDHTRIMERREPHKRGTIPPRGLILVTSADVQMRGIWVETVAYAPNRESWVVDADYLDGETTSPREGAFLKLNDWYEREFPDAFGGKRRADLFGVDSGYRSNVVYLWCRQRPGAMALDGRDGWGRPAIGLPSPVDINLDGKRIRRGSTLYPVGTWPLKATFYSDLRKDGARAGAELDPPGYCHFGDWLDEVYFRQVTAEYLADEKIRGRSRKVWKPRSGQENHLLDCRVYNLALALHLGLETMTPDDWTRLARERGMPEPDIAGSLFAPAPLAIRGVAIPSSPAREPIPADEPPPASGLGGYLDGYEMEI